MSDASTHTLSGILRRRRITARTRLTLVFTGLLVACGLLMLATLFVVMKYVPTYAFASTTPNGDVSVSAAPLDPLHGVPASPWPTADVDAATSDMNAPTVEGASPLMNVSIVVRSEDDVLHTLLSSSAVVLLLAIAVGSFASWLIAGRLLKPVHEITLAAKRASEGSLDHRIGLAGPRDEFTELSDTFDTMLDRLERSFGAHERFAANAAHELRTPLTTTKALLHLAQDRPDTVDVARLVTGLAETNERSIGTVEALLNLAESSHHDIILESVDLSGVVDRTTRALTDEADASEVTVTVESEPGLLVAGDEVLLERLVTNLAQNAIRHNRMPGTAHVSVSREADAVVLIVTNTGAAISAATAARLTEPFYRVAGRISSTGPRGHGLGLALTANIAQAHDAELAVTTNEPGGLTVTVRFPTA
ncbi:sensor histidine kinase [Plantibacter sp. YIM 135347]|uniref:sensor histidine kinase n=1 Tax=Plantibacter sp. YIM 135347 TaxID=3423919 RepID=UPI003D33027E